MDRIFAANANGGGHWPPPLGYLPNDVAIRPGYFGGTAGRRNFTKSESTTCARSM